MKLEAWRLRLFQDIADRSLSDKQEWLGDGDVMVVVKVMVVM